MIPRALLAAACAAFVACSKGAPSPVIEAVEPARVPAGVAFEAVVRGREFHLRVEANLDDPAASEEIRPRVSFSLGEARLDAVEVVWRSTSELWVRAPALGPGAWDVTVTDGWGRTASLSGAVVVTGCVGAADCDDGLGCTTDACVAGECAHEVVPGACAIDGACLTAAEVVPGQPCQICDPATSATAPTLARDGASCEDGDLCTTGEQCAQGQCVPKSAVVCPKVACQSVTCNPATGGCDAVAVQDGLACDDGRGCGTLPNTDACFSGACVGSCGDVPPIGCLSVGRVAAHLLQAVSFDASCSSKASATSLDMLEFRYDFGADGTWDSNWSADPHATFVFPSPGVWSVLAEVRAKSSGLSGFALRHVSVEDPSMDVVVTTGADEDDPGASPTSGWGGDGCSLREAIAWVNQAMAPARIRFSPGLEVNVSGKHLPPILPPRLQFVGEDDVRLRFSTAIPGPANACLQLAGARQVVVGLSAEGCPTNLLDLDGDDSIVSDSRFTGAGLQVAAAGVRAKGMGARIGPGVEVSGFGLAGVDVKGGDTLVVGLRSHHNGDGLRVSASSSGTAYVQRSILHDNHEDGVDVGANAEILSCTSHGNVGNGIAIGNFTGAVTVVNTLATGNAGYGLAGALLMVPTRTPNGYFGNGKGAISSAATAPGDLVSDPTYLRRGAGDFRLSRVSPAIGRGMPWPGFDFNGPAPGTVNGFAPDLGAEESPW